MKRGAGRPRSGYRLADGTRVPGSTTITGRFKDSGGLVWWANQEGLAGRDTSERRDEAATAGSIAHDWIEDALHGDPPRQFPDADPFLVMQAEVGFTAYREWADLVGLTLLESEVPLVSERYGYGGTLDALALVRTGAGDEPVLFDWKTSSGSYPDYIAQVASYRQLLRERDGNAAPRRAFLVRFGKEHGDFHFHSYPPSVLDMGWRWFELALELYGIDKGLKKVAA